MLKVHKVLTRAKGKINSMNCDTLLCECMANAGHFLGYEKAACGRVSSGLVAQKIGK